MNAPLSNLQKSWLVWSLWLGLFSLAGSGRGEIVFDNTKSIYETYYPSKLEFGDDVFFSTGDRWITVTNFQLEYYCYFDPAASEKWITVRLYANDGPPVAQEGYENENFNTPKSLLYVSTPIPLYPGFNTISLTDLGVLIQKRMTFSVKFENFSGHFTDFASLPLYDPPVLGSSFGDFWVNVPPGQLPNGLQGWVPYHFPNFNPQGNFGVRVMAASDVTVEIVSIERLPNGNNKLILQGPTLQTAVLEFSTDQTHWTPLQTFSFEGVPIEYIDTQATANEQRFYRLQLLDEMPIRFISNTRSPDGKQLLLLSGPPGRSFTIETSTDMSNWFSVHTNTFTSLTYNYTDDQAKFFLMRFYRAQFAPDLSVVLQSIQALTNGTTLLIFSGPPGRLCAVERSTDLLAWTSMSTNTFSFNGGQLTYIDKEPTNNVQRYYRGSIIR